MANILIVEDEEHLATGIKFNLEMEGHDVVVVADGRDAVAHLAGPAPRDAFDLVILDVMLPGADGFEVLRQARDAGNFTPILMLTAKNMPGDVVRGLETGADDYLPKPFDLAVLLARVKGLLRRREWARGGSDVDTVRIGESDVDFRSFELTNRGQTLRLTQLEAMLLKHLVANAGRVVSKAELLEKVWNVSPESETRSVDNFILRLRRYIEPNPRFPRHLHTVRGAGYKLVLEA
jgi:two-component system alkaline phosphatase synthesis response regulator PhoP